MPEFIITTTESTRAVSLAWQQDALEESDAPASITVHGPDVGQVHMHGVAVPVVHVGGTCVATGEVDGSRTTGAVRIEAWPQQGVGSSRLDILFPQATAARIEFVRSLALTDVALPRLRGGFQYLDPHGVLRTAVDESRVIVFVRDHGRTAIDLLAAVAANPETASELVERIQSPGAPFDPRATERYLVGRPHLMARDPAGVVEHRGSRFSPLLTIARRAKKTHNTPANRTLAQFARLIWRDTSLIASSHPDQTVRSDLAAFAASLRTTLASSRLSELRGPGPRDPERVHEGHYRPEYRALLGLAATYTSKVTPGMTHHQLERQFLARPEDVFQALCGYVIAAALGLDQQHGADGSADWQSPTWSLWLNRRGRLPSWRDSSIRPDEYRPDILLRRRHDPWDVVLIDAKYSAVERAQVPGDRLKEVQAYLNAYGLRRAGVMYPGTPEAALRGEGHDIMGAGFLLREIPIYPVDPDDIRSMLDVIRRQLKELSDQPRI